MVLGGVGRCEGFGLLLAGGADFAVADRDVVCGLRDLPKLGGVAFDEFEAARG